MGGSRVRKFSEAVEGVWGDEWEDGKSHLRFCSDVQVRV